MDLTNISLRDCKPFIPNISIGKVVKVYDGDTMTVACKLDGEYYKFNVRIRGVDCPEMRTKKGSERMAAHFVQAHMEKFILNRLVQLHDIAYDKYGRILARVVMNNVDLGEYLLTHRLAVEYDGGSKENTPDDWMRFIRGKKKSLFSRLFSIL